MYRWERRVGCGKQTNKKAIKNNKERTQQTSKQKQQTNKYLHVDFVCTDGSGEWAVGVDRNKQTKKQQKITKNEHNQLANKSSKQTNTCMLTFYVHMRAESRRSIERLQGMAFDDTCEK